MTEKERPALSLLPEGTTVRTSLFVSYLLILFLPILLSLIVFFGSYQVTSRQAENTVAVVGQHLAALVDTYLDEARSESFALILNDYSQKLMNYTATSPTTRQIIYLSELQKEMCPLPTLKDRKGFDIMERTGGKKDGKQKRKRTTAIR